MTASNRVLGTVELLEGILLYLPTRDLLLAQRVSKHWQDVICQSITLQRALFFEPEKGDPLALAEDDNYVKKYWVRLGEDREQKLLKNPLLDRLFQEIESDGTDFSLRAGLPIAWRNKCASWRRMLFAQPAILTSTYVCLYGLADFWCAFYTEKTMPLFSTKDVRIGQIFDELDEKYGKFPYGKKRIMVVGLGNAFCEESED